MWKPVSDFATDKVTLSWSRLNALAWKPDPVQDGDKPVFVTTEVPTWFTCPLCEQHLFIFIYFSCLLSPQDFTFPVEEFEELCVTTHSWEHLFKHTHVQHQKK